MKYLICQDWSNTRGNHAGMRHMCHLLVREFPDDYQMIVVPDFYSFAIGSRFMRRIQCYLMRRTLVPVWYCCLGILLSLKSGKKDSIYLLEYLEKMYPQIYLASVLRYMGQCPNVYALVHLVPEKIQNSFTVSELVKWAKYVQGFLTFGTSLTEFLTQNKALESNDITTLFHYVDIEYYQPAESFAKKDRAVQVLAMGNQKRNYELLKRIVHDNPEVDFTICQGVMDLRPIFQEFSNVKLVGFVAEIELLHLMQNSDISLNVMEDTIGSNVIVTSLSVGMALVNSDVGSIRNYCDESCAIFCKNDDPSSFSLAIQTLVNDPERLASMKKNAYQKSQKFSIHKFHEKLQLLVPEAV